MHDVAKEGLVFWLLMPDRTLHESQIAADLIRKGLTADEAVEILEKRREVHAE
jgi:hypothetical protein